MNFRRYRKYTLADALRNPQQIFGFPENVMSDPRLDRGAKLAILRKWRDLLVEDCAPRRKTGDGQSSRNAILLRVKRLIGRLDQNRKPRSHRP